MKPRVTVITLGVDDLNRSLAFYRDSLVRTKEEVDVVMAEADRAGARILKPAHATFWGGYAGYFQDPDEHLWEVVWSPQFGLSEGSTKWV